MWLLRNDSKGLVYRVTPGKQHIVTRKDGDLLLLGDQSISRKHALLQIDEENETNGIVVKDLGSKYGTFIIIGDGELTQLSPNQQTTLRNGDSVRFGIQWNCWRAELIYLLVTNSTLNAEERAEVKQMVESLGGKVVNDWQAECSHLTMNKITVTIKVVCALATAQPIVTPSYWRAFSQSLTTMETTLPDCKDFVPPLAEAMLNPSEVSFMPNPERSKLFNGYTFVAASTKQLVRIKPMITAAGGKAVEFSTRVWTEEKLLKDKAILMLSSASDRQGSQQSQVFDGYMPVARKLKSTGVRCIPESEIGLSVIYCSMSQYCNPRFTNQSLINSSSTGQATQRVTVICPNTEESMSIDQENIDTVPGTTVQSATKKRPLEDISKDQEPPGKRPDLRENSEDLFGSQDENHPQTVSRSKKTECLNKPQQKPIRTNPAPSLDMFAPSGERSGLSNTPKPSVVARSCEDMFASTGSRTQNAKNLERDEFSFSQSKSNKEPLDEVNKKDGFSFPETKCLKVSQTKAEIVDEFSFKSNKSSNVTLRSGEEEEDAFSFASTKRINKRNQQSNQDMFASSADESSIGPSKRVHNFSFTNSKPNLNEDNLFAFPDDHNPKRRRTYGEVFDLNETGSNVKLALLSNDCETEPGPSSIPQELDDAPESKNLITYSKLNPIPTKVKKEIENDEIDDLVKDLFDATIVIFKPLVVAKEKPQKSSAPESSVKNFKKFKKVVGTNKRIIPHIIGGSDLVSHFNVVENLENGASSTDNAVLNDEDDDEWAFGRNKTNKRIR